VSRAVTADLPGVTRNLKESTKPTGVISKNLWGFGKKNLEARIVGWGEGKKERESPPPQMGSCWEKRERIGGPETYRTRLPVGNQKFSGAKSHGEK